MIRFATTVVVLLLAGVAAVVSYRHAYEVVVLNGEAGFTAYLVPLTIDGAIFAASLVMLEAARRDRPVPALARWTLALGILATLAANVAHGWAHGPVGAIVAAWPAIALVLSYELLMGMVRRGGVPAPVVVEVEAEAVPAGVQEWTRVPSGTGTATEEISSVEPADVPAELLASPAPTPILVPAPDDLFPVAADRYADVLAEGKVPAVSKIKTELKVGQPRAVRIRTYLTLLTQS